MLKINPLQVLVGQYIARVGLLICTFCICASPVIAQGKLVATFLKSERIGVGGDLNVRIHGNVHLSNTIQVDSNASIYFYGDQWLTDSNETPTVSGKVHFSSDSTQFVLGDTIRFRHVVIDNVGDVQLGGCMWVEDSVSLAKGKLVLRGNELILDSKAGIGQYSHTRYIVTDTSVTGRHGYISCLGLDSSRGRLAIPIGGSDHYAPLQIENSGSRDFFTFYVRDDVRVDGDSGAPSNFEHCRSTWFIDEGVSGGSNVSISLQNSLSKSTSNFNVARRFVSHFNGTSPNNGGDSTSYTKWDMMKIKSTTDSIRYGDITTDTILLDHMVTDRDSITSFSPLTVRSYPLSSLPVSWLAFNARWFNQGVGLEWSTASETNNAGFSLMRSYEGVQYEVIDFVPGQSKSGHSTQILQYNYIDNEVAEDAEEVYYHMVQHDFDGTTTNSKVVRLTRNMNNEGDFNLYPNPSAGTINVHYTTNATSVYTVKVCNALGQLVANYYQLESNVVHEVELNLASGVYVVQIDNDEYPVSVTKRIILE